MERRSFFGHIAAAFAGWFGYAPRHVPKPLIELSPMTFAGGTVTGLTNFTKRGCTYCWGGRMDAPWSDDPDWAACSPPYGDCNRVFLDGVDVSKLYINKLRTGREGFIEFESRDGDKLQFGLWDHKKGGWEDEPPGPEHCVDRNEIMRDAEGRPMTLGQVRAPGSIINELKDKPFYRYEDRVRTEIRRGHVEYFVAPLDANGKPILNSAGRPLPEFTDKVPTPTNPRT